MQKQVRKLALSGVLIAMGLILSTFYVPIGASKVFPMQHLINVLSACLLGPAYGLLNAFVISLLRNILGMGTLLAFPGSMVGALLAALLFKKFKSFKLAALGEFVGTGILGALLAAPLANLVLGKGVSPLFFVIPFSLSTALGCVIALLILEGSQALRLQFLKRHEENE